MSSCLVLWMSHSRMSSSSMSRVTMIWRDLPWPSWHWQQSCSGACPFQDLTRAVWPWLPEMTYTGIWFQLQLWQLRGRLTAGAGALAPAVLDGVESGVILCGRHGRKWRRWRGIVEAKGNWCGVKGKRLVMLYNHAHISQVPHCWCTCLSPATWLVAQHTLINEHLALGLAIIVHDIEPQLSPWQHQPHIHIVGHQPVWQQHIQVQVTLRSKACPLAIIACHWTRPSFPWSLNLPAYLVALCLRWASQLSLAVLP